MCVVLNNQPVWLQATLVRLMGFKRNEVLFGVKRKEEEEEEEDKNYYTIQQNKNINYHVKKNGRHRSSFLISSGLLMFGLTC